MVIIFALLGLWAIFGVGGLLVGLLIGILSAIIKYGNSEEESYLTKQDRQADPKNQTHETCQQERQEKACIHLLRSHTLPGMRQSACRRAGEYYEVYRRIPKQIL